MKYTERFYLDLILVFILVIAGLFHSAMSFAEEDTGIKISDSAKDTITKVSREKGCAFKIDSATNKKRDKMTILIDLQDAPNKLNAFGFDLFYDIQALKFHAYSKGELVSSNYMFGVNEIKDGVVRVGGFRRGSSQIGAGDSGTLVKLEFKVTLKEKPAAYINKISLINQVDDIRGWSVCPYNS